MHDTNQNFILEWSASISDDKQTDDRKKNGGIGKYISKKKVFLPVTSIHLHLLHNHVAVTTVSSCSVDIMPTSVWSEHKKAAPFDCPCVEGGHERSASSFGDGRIR